MMDLLEFLQFAFIFGSLFLIFLFITVRFFLDYLNAFGVFNRISFQLVIVLRLISVPYPIIRRHDEEKIFIDPVTGQKEKFPTIEDEPTVDLSVIVPAYDEEKRCKSL